MNRSNRYHINAKRFYICLAFVLGGIAIAIIIQSYSTIWRGAGNLIMMIFGLVITLCLARARRHDAACHSNYLSHVSTDDLLKQLSPAPVNDATTIDENLKAPILYLRPFSDEGEHFILGTNNVTSEEEHLAYIFKDAGTFITMGNPQDEVPPLGAIRLYRDPEKWQSEVIGWMKIARFVILRTGTSDGFLWELSTALRLMKPEQIIILADKNKEDYELFCTATQRFFTKPLPEFNHVNKPLRGSISGLIYFKSDWTPIFSSFQRERLRPDYKYPLAPSMMIGFEPVFKQLAIPWQCPAEAIPVSEMVTFIAVVFLTLTIILLVMSA